MKGQQFDDNNRYNIPAMPPSVSPITQPNMPPAVSPITQPPVPPTSPIMQPRKPLGPPCPFMPPPGTTFPPPGTAFNPIGVPPWAGMQPGTSPSVTIPIQQPTMPPSTSRPPTGTIPQPGPPVLRSDDYLQGHLKQYIGRPVKVEFILGTNMLVDREGILLDVGIDHIVIRETRTDDMLFCDLYSIKFVTIYL